MNALRTWTCIGFLAIYSFGCQVAPPQLPANLPGASNEPALITIREGDVLKITFPGAPSLDTTQAVRRDGRITLASAGEMLVLNKTPSELKQDLLNTYDAQLVSKQVSVTVMSSIFPVFVSGAVLRPGKIQADRPLTALEAVMEAGGFDRTKANPRQVTVIRNENGRTVRQVLDLQAILDGKQTEQFYLRPNDILDVPEKFNWF